MPSIEQHLNQAKRNVEFFTSFEQHANLAGYSEWSITIRFYFGVHVVEAMFSLFGVHCANHDDRGAKIAGGHSVRLPVSDNLKGAYMDLYSLSRKARYLSKNGAPTSTQDFLDASDHYEVIRTESFSFLKSVSSVDKSLINFME